MDNRLLAKYLFNEADERERAVVERWMAEDEAHRQEVERIRRQLELGTRRYRPGLFSPREAEVKLGIRRRGIPRSVWWASAAAAAVLCFVIGRGWLAPGKIVESTVAGFTREVYLPDSSRVTLAGKTELVYSKSFGEREREVMLDGTAFFEVKADTTKTFVVNTAALHVEVLGTAFQVTSAGKRTEVWVERGRVRVTTTDGKQSAELTAGMSAAHERGDAGVEVEETYDPNVLSWKTGVLEFRNAPLRQVVARLNEHYRAHVALPCEWESLTLTVTFRNVSLQEALEVINSTLEIQLRP